jgi:hypothetical protein
MSKIGKTLYLVDETGEVIETLSDESTYVKVDAGDRVLRKNSIDSYEEMITIPMRFLKVNFKVFGKICLKYPIMLSLLEYIQYQTGKLVYRNGRLVKRKDLPRICEVSSATIDRQLKGLMKDDVIKSQKEDNTTVYYINPFVVHFGKQIYECSFKLFKDSIYRENYEELL